MRYLHYEAEKIAGYIEERQLHVFKCDYDGKAGPVEVSADIIEEMWKASETLWGTCLSYFAIASQSSQIEKTSLVQAVSEIEGAKSSDKFAVVAYQDGGLITVSGFSLPFQVCARLAAWWVPTVPLAWLNRLADWKKRLIG